MSESEKKKEVIKIGDVELSNSQLAEIVRGSAEIAKGTELERNEQFMKELNNYADQKSKEIVEQTVVNASKQQKAAKPAKPSAPKTSPEAAKVKVPTPPPPPPTKQAPTAPIVANRVLKPPGRRNRHMMGKFVNPYGADTKHFVQPMDLGGEEFKTKEHERCLAAELREHLEQSLLYLKSPVDIAKELLRDSFNYKFQFALDIFYSTTGIVRTCKFMYTGDKTFADIFYHFRHRYCDSEIIQWFYLNHEGHLFEVHDDLSLKQMLITHGAFPMGFSEPKRETAKVLCIPRSVLTEDNIVDRESDLILGAAPGNARMDPERIAKMAENMMFHLSPDAHYEHLFHQTIVYTLDQVQWEYNGQMHIITLVDHVQRELEIDELFSDPRGDKLVSYSDVLRLVLNRYHNPYRNCSGKESVQIEIQSVLDQLRRSRHQTASDLNYLERMLMDRTAGLR